MVPRPICEEPLMGDLGSIIASDRKERHGLFHLQAGREVTGLLAIAALGHPLLDSGFHVRMDRIETGAAVPVARVIVCALTGTSAQ